LQQKIKEAVAKKKLQQFAEIASFPNVFQHLQFRESIDDLHLKGKWNEHYFKNDHPIVLELGCGKGEYTVGMAEAFTEKNFIGVDLKGNRIWKGAKTALENTMAHVAFVRTHIENIESIFGPGEISEIWITFPDPQPQKSREKKRLTALPFLNRYRNILCKGGVIHLKTDSALLYEYTLDIIRENKFELIDHSSNLYRDPAERSAFLTNIKTHYEKLFSQKGFDICYVQFRIN
jgi:tRNA (guanine-N7-)-methyltransferase